MVENVENYIKGAWQNLWWDMLLRGAIAIIFGLLIFFWPGLSIATFVLLFASFVFIDGVLLLLQAVTIKDGRWWVRLVQGIVGIAAGIAAFVWPGLTALMLLYIIAFYLIFTGVLQVFGAIEMRKAIKGELLLIASGILSVIIGLLMFARPLTGAIALAQTIGIFAIAYGILIAILALKLRGVGHKAATAT
jgi:uncharacterized membrane protein HdeD (DUF308 family)